VGIFTLGNSSDAFLVLRAKNLGITVTGILMMLVVFNLVYSLVSTPAGSRSDRIDRRYLIIGGWSIYAAIYLGFALAQAGWQVWVLYVVYGLYYGMAYGTANAMVADLVPDSQRGTAYGTYHALIGFLAFPASFIAGLLWQGAGAWAGFGPQRLLCSAQSGSNCRCVDGFWFHASNGTHGTDSNTIGLNYAKPFPKVTVW
jgi:MFS family permease